MKAYQAIPVWVHINTAVCVCYVCMRDIESNKFAVQSADFYRMPADQKQIRDHSAKFLELFIEVSPAERCEWYSSLQEAIEAHIADFGPPEQATQQYLP